MYGIYWDCDGTLMDTETSYGLAWKEHLKNYVLNSNNGPLLLNYFENYLKTLKKNTLNSYIKSVSNR